VAQGKVISQRSGRGEDRVRTVGIIVCRRGTNRQEAQLLDLSRSGMRLMINGRLHPDERVWLKLPMLEPLEGRVIWVTGFEAGCEFAASLHPAVFEIVTKAMRMT
jgi:hypothetical protein